MINVLNIDAVSDWIKNTKSFLFHIIGYINAYIKATLILVIS